MPKFRVIEKKQLTPEELAKKMDRKKKKAT